MGKKQDTTSTPPDDKIKDHTESARVKEWQRKIDLGIKWRQRTSGNNDELWNLYEKYYKGDWWEKNELGVQFLDRIKDYLPANRVFAYIKAILPRIYFRNPGIIVTKGKIEQLANGQSFDDKDIIQDYIKYLIKEIKLKRSMKSVGLKGLIVGVGIIKEGFGSEFVAGKEDSSTQGKRVEYDSTIKVGLPWVKDVSPTHFVLPWGTKHIDSARWCAELVIRHIDDAKADTNYKHRDQLKPTSTEKLDNLSRAQLGEEGKQNDWVRLWEIRDKKTGKFFIISAGSDKFHVEDEDILTIENFPYRMVVFDEDPSSAWGISAVKIMEPQQLELNDIKTQMSAHRKREVTKIAVDPKALIGKTSLEDINDASEPMAAIPVKEPEKNIKVIASGMPSDLPLMAQDADNDIKFEVGFSRNQAGEVSQGRRTAFEISKVDESAEIRNDERRDTMAEMFEEVIHDLMLISFRHVSVDMVKNITGGRWHERDTKAIIYDFGLEVNPEEARPVNTQLIRAEATELYDRLIASPVSNQITPIVDLVKAYGKRNFADYIDPGVAAIVQQFLDQREQAAEQSKG